MTVDGLKNFFENEIVEHTSFFKNLAVEVGKEVASGIIDAVASIVGVAALQLAGAYDDKNATEIASKYLLAASLSAFGGLTSTGFLMMTGVGAVSAISDEVFKAGI